MEKVTIEMPDNLTQEQEWRIIALQLGMKMLPGSKRTKQITDSFGTVQLEIKELDTQITIKRVSAEKPILLRHCNVCGCDYANELATSAWHNYGGKAKRIYFCSDDCRQIMIDQCGSGRMAIRKKELQRICASVHLRD